MNTLINASELGPKAISSLRSNPRFKEIFIHEYREEEGEEGVMVPITYFWPKRPMTRRGSGGSGGSGCSGGSGSDEDDEELCMDPKLLEMRRDQEMEDERIKQIEEEYEETV